MHAYGGQKRVGFAKKKVKVKQCCQKQMCIIRYSSFFLAPRGRRGWKKFYAVLKGTILYLQKVTVVDRLICCFMLSPKQSCCPK